MATREKKSLSSDTVWHHPELQITNDELRNISKNLRPKRLKWGNCRLTTQCVGADCDRRWVGKTTKAPRPGGLVVGVWNDVGAVNELEREVALRGLWIWRNGVHA